MDDMKWLEIAVNTTPDKLDEVTARLTAAAILLCLRFVFPLFFLPALAALIDSLLVEPMFKPFLPKDEP